MAQGFRWAAAFALLAGLAGCGGSDYADGGPTPPAPGPGGFYAGVLVSDVSGYALNAVALVSADGHMRIVDTVLDRQFLATFPASGSRWQGKLMGYAGPLAGFPDGSRQCTGTVDGSAYAAAELIAEYDCGGDHGTLELDFNDSVSFNPPDVAELTGEVQGILLPHTILVLTIAPDGSYTGSDTAGCSYSGTFTAADPILNLYDLQLKQTCGTQTLTLAGTAVQGFDPHSGNPALYYGVSDPSHSLAGKLVFQ